MSHVTSLGHVGIAVRDLDKMLDFYTRILGLTITDRIVRDGVERGAFLSARPETEHHELVLGVAPDANTNAQQISFTVGSLDDLREMYRAVKDYGCTFDMITNHGIAFGCYFRDPEGNEVEVYWPTGVDYPQPHVEDINLESTNEQLLEALKKMTPKAGSAPRYYGKDVGNRLPADANGLAKNG